MYTTEKINKVLKEVFGEETNRHSFFNGERAEGLSVIIPSSISSYALEELICLINEAHPNETTITEFEVRKLRPEMITVPEKVSTTNINNSCELRLIQKDFYSYPKGKNWLKPFKDTIDSIDGTEFDSHDFIRKLMEKHPHVYANILLKHENVTYAHAEIGRFLINNSEEGYKKLSIKKIGEKISLDVFLNDTPCALWNKTNNN